MCVTLWEKLAGLQKACSTTRCEAVGLGAFTTSATSEGSAAVSGAIYAARLLHDQFRERLEIAGIESVYELYVIGEHNRHELQIENIRVGY